MKLYVSAPGERPDFRLVVAFLWRDGQDVDSDGDSYNPASRHWTELYLRNRADGSERVDVGPARRAPLILEVESELEYLAARAAYFLARRTGGGVSRSPDGEYEDPESLLGLVGAAFDVAGAMRRVRVSPFARATPGDPYPNLREP